MIIIINGPLGIGKTEASWDLLDLLEKGVMLDGDYIGAVRPFDIYDEGRIEYLYQTLRLLVVHHVEHGYRDFVINYVFEEPESLARLVELLSGLAGEIYAYRLTCTYKEATRRMTQRSPADPDKLAWEFERFQQLVSIQEQAAQRGPLGEVVDTTVLTAHQVAEKILKLTQEKYDQV